MSLDWIRVDKRLPEGPKILRIIELTGLERDTILGRLWRFWAWVDSHVKADGLLHVANVAILVRTFGGEDCFWLALVDVGWLGQGEAGFFIPEWDRWFSQSAKTRQGNAERQRKSRAQKQITSVTPKCDNGHTPVTPNCDNGHAPVTAMRDQSRGDEKENIWASTSTSAADAPREIDWDMARTNAKRIVEKLDWRGQLSDTDRDLVMKVAALIEILGENFVWDAVEAVRLGTTRKSRGAHLHAVMSSKCKEAGKNFNALLKKLKPRALPTILRNDAAA
jgi:hypothetical protein